MTRDSRNEISKSTKPSWSLKNLILLQMKWTNSQREAACTREKSFKAWVTISLVSLRFICEMSFACLVKSRSIASLLKKTYIIVPSSSPCFTKESFLRKTSARIPFTQFYPELSATDSSPFWIRGRRRKSNLKTDTQKRTVSSSYHSESLAYFRSREEIALPF